MEKLTYSKAIDELDEIISKLENAEIQLDEVPKILERAKKLFDYCQNLIHLSQNTLDDMFNSNKDI